MVGAADLLVSSDRVIETPAYEFGKAFRPEMLNAPSLHIRVRYDRKNGWQSYYPGERAPSNIASFLEDCRRLGLHILHDEAHRASAHPASSQPTAPASK